MQRAFAWIQEHPGFHPVILSRPYRDWIVFVQVYGETEAQWTCGSLDRPPDAHGSAALTFVIPSAAEGSAVNSAGLATAK